MTETGFRRIMDEGRLKCVVVLAEDLPAGLQANTAGVLSFTLGSELREVVGSTVVDGSGEEHLGITEIPIPMLSAAPETVAKIRREAGHDTEAVVVAFTDAAQTSKTYDEYRQKMASRGAEDLRYLGVGLCGEKKLVNRLTGSLPLLR
jgi:hypothetical protein